MTVAVGMVAAARVPGFSVTTAGRTGGALAPDRRARSCWPGTTIGAARMSGALSEEMKALIGVVLSFSATIVVGQWSDTRWAACYAAAIRTNFSATTPAPHAC
ncbi:hypothetical protein [Acuticoccus sediminis]|uniref:hypothetical protein n=1 Tax=Acuticoccus sediminis TaxID=2184697 RepID=UPI0011B944E3|nr:hypothetical protein [Acuticoccus sediminis]